MTRRTRILATLGPASDSPDTIRALLRAGADAFRLNFSHGTHDEHEARCKRIREAAADVGRDVPIVQDLGGPKIRVGTIDPAVTLEDGATLVIEHGDFAGTADRVSCTFEALFTSVGRGDRLRLNDGRIDAEVVGTAPGRLTTKVIEGGVLSSHKGINVPGVALRTSALTAKDHDDLRAGVAMGVDIIGVSFVQSADDVQAAREALERAGGGDVPIIAKIEKPAAVDQIDAIARVADGLMVARGDLGIEVPLATVPAVQKRIIAAARRRGVPVILATEVLESMRTEPRPTRAEVTDAANAVDEGVDAIMLAGETAAGRYPVEAVETLGAILRAAEQARKFDPAPAADASTSSPHRRALCEAAVALASRAGAAVIVALTEAGSTARLLASLRPDATIVAATPSARTAARLNLVWGVNPIVTADASPAAIRDALVSTGAASRDDVVVFVSIGQQVGRDGRNFVSVEAV